jgi:hypothetical protein
LGVFIWWRRMKFKFILGFFSEFWSLTIKIASFSIQTRHIDQSRATT